MDVEVSKVDSSDPTVDAWTVSGRDKAGRPLSIDRTRDGATTPETYTYDGPGRVASVNGAVVGWDPDGNRVSHRGQTASFRADGSISGPGVTYDPAGNLLTADCRTNTYDGLDRLVGTDGCSKPAVTTTYDGLDRQATSTTSGKARQIRYTDTGSTVLAEEDATAPKTARYLLGPRRGRPGRHRQHQPAADVERRSSGFDGAHPHRRRRRLYAAGTTGC